MVAALGLFGDPGEKLQIFDSVSREQIKMARKLAESVQVQINARWKGPGVYTEAKVRMNNGAWGRARIKNEHDKVVLVDSNRKNFLKVESGKGADTPEASAGGL
ncbi:MAG: hypothetical protein ACUVQM_06890 [Candidatus Hadarchaeaceae archaeon]